MRGERRGWALCCQNSEFSFFLFFSPFFLFFCFFFCFFKLKIKFWFLSLYKKKERGVRCDCHYHFQKQQTKAKQNQISISIMPVTTRQQIKQELEELIFLQIELNKMLEENAKTCETCGEENFDYCQSCTLKDPLKYFTEFQWAVKSLAKRIVISQERMD